MDFALGPLLRQIFMAKLEQTSLKTKIGKVDFYCRHMDGVFIICSTELNLNTLLTAFDSARPSKTLTTETEEEGRLPFLELVLYRKPDGVLRR